MISKTNNLDWGFNINYPVRWNKITEEKLTAKEVANILNESRSTIYKKLRNGKIDGYKENNEWVIIVSETKNQDIYEEFVKEKPKLKIKDLKNLGFGSFGFEEISSIVQSIPKPKGLIDQNPSRLSALSKETNPFSTSGSFNNFGINIADEFIRRDRIKGLVSNGFINNKLNYNLEKSLKNLVSDSKIFDSKLQQNLLSSSKHYTDLYKELQNYSLSSIERFKMSESELFQPMQIASDILASMESNKYLWNKQMTNFYSEMNKNLFNNFNMDSLGFFNYEEIQKINNLGLKNLNYSFEKIVGEYSLNELNNLIDRTIPYVIKYSQYHEETAEAFADDIALQNYRMYLLATVILIILLNFLTINNMHTVNQIFMYIWNYLKSNPLLTITMPFSFMNININFGDINILPKYYNYSPKKVVSIDNLKVRKKANNSSEIVCILNKNTYQVRVLVEKGNWCKIEVLNSSNYKGWVKKNGLSQLYLN